MAIIKSDVIGLTKRLTLKCLGPINDILLEIGDGERMAIRTESNLIRVEV
jgi:hypothetical protein